MHRHPVTLARERPRHSPADATGCPGDQDRVAPTAAGGRQLSSHRDSSLVVVAQFLAVAATPAWPARRKSTWASSLVPKPSGVCRYSAGPIAATASRLPLATAAFCA